MDATSRNGRLLFVLSTALSLAGLAASLAAGLPRAATVAAAALTLLHLAALALGRRQGALAALAPRARQAVLEDPAVWLLAASVLGSGSGALSWIIYFEPGSTVRELLLVASPLLGWMVAMSAAVLLVSGTAIASRGSRDAVLLAGAAVFPLAGGLFFFWLAAQLFPFTIDDAFITFRYSRHLAAGWGPTYNPGAPPVEGYTTFLWMLLMAVPHLAGLNVAAASKAAGVLLASGTFLLCGLLVYHRAREGAVAARLFFGSFAAFLTAMLPITAVHAVSGMETSLFTFLLVLMVLLVAEGTQRDPRLLSWAPLAGLGLGLTRPEGNMIAALLLLAGWGFSRAVERRRLARAAVFTYVLPGALYFAWRAWYYRLAFPLPFYMKVLHGSGLAGAGEVASYLGYLLPAVSVLAALALLRFRPHLLVLLLPVGFLLGFYLFPVHAMGFDWRFVYPATPLVFVLAASGALVLYGSLDQERDAGPPWEWALLGALLLTSLGNLSGLDGLIDAKRTYGAGVSNYKSFGEVLHAYDPQGRSTLAIGDAGAIPYYSGWQVIDLFGLNSREVAFGLVPVPALVFEVQPVDLIVLSVGPNRSRISDEHAGAQLLYTQATGQGMQRIASFPFGRSNFVWVVGYPDSDLAAYIQEHLAINAE